MRAPLSIIIPTLNAADALQRSLPALTEGVKAGLVRELVISDGGSTDATERVSGEAGAVWVSGPAGRGGQLRRGVEAAEGEWLLILHADTVLGDGWSESVLDHMPHPENAAYFRLRFDVNGVAPQLVAGWANMRSRLFSLPYGDQGLLISATLYHGIGGYPDIPLMEDVAIAKALKGKLVQLPVSATTGSDKYLHEGWFRRGARNLTTLVRFLLRVSPERLAQNYDRRSR